MITTLKAHYEAFTQMDPRHRFLILTAAAALILGVGFLLIKAVTTAVAGPTRGGEPVSEYTLDFPDSDSVLADADARFAAWVSEHGEGAVIADDSACYFVVDTLTSEVVPTADDPSRFEVFCGPVRLPSQATGTWVKWVGETEVLRDGSVSAALFDRTSPVDDPRNHYDQFHSLLNDEGSVALDHADTLSLYSPEANVILDPRGQGLEGFTAEGVEALKDPGFGPVKIPILTHEYTGKTKDTWDARSYGTRRLVVETDTGTPIALQVDAVPYVLDEAGEQWHLDPLDPNKLIRIRVTNPDEVVGTRITLDREIPDYEEGGFVNELVETEVIGIRFGVTTIPLDGNEVLIAHPGNFLNEEGNPQIWLDVMTALQVAERGA